jgi:hypothetical protein
MTMTVEERKMSRPDSRWKAELLNLYRSAESCRSEITDATNVEYQTGVMAACQAIWFRVTGEDLIQRAAVWFSSPSIPSGHPKKP